jgi:hypothetical protein
MIWSRLDTAIALRLHVRALATARSAARTAGSECALRADRTAVRPLSAQCAVRTAAVRCTVRSFSLRSAHENSACVHALRSKKTQCARFHRCAFTKSALKIPQCGPQAPHRGTAVRSSPPALRPRPVAEPRPVAWKPLPIRRCGAVRAAEALLRACSPHPDLLRYIVIRLSFGRGAVRVPWRVGAVAGRWMPCVTSAWTSGLKRFRVIFVVSHTAHER